MDDLTSVNASIATLRAFQILNSIDSCSRQKPIIGGIVNIVSDSLYYTKRKKNGDNLK